MPAAPSLRVATLNDAERIADIYAPFVRDTAISFETIAPEMEEMRRRISTTLITHPWLVAESDGRVTGYAYASQHRTRDAYRWACDVAVYLLPEAQGRGVGSLLYTELLRILTSQGFRSAFAGIALPNTASVALHEKLGFLHLGTYAEVGFKFGLWHDVGWWQRILQTGTGVPNEITPFEHWSD